MKNLFLLFAVALVLGSCNMSYEKTKSGVRYKIFKGKGGEKLKAGDIIKFNQIGLIPERDTVLFTTYGKMPGFVKIDTGASTIYTVMEVMQKMSVGDSAVVVLSIDSLISKGMLNTSYNNTFRRGGQITFRMRIIKKFADEQAANAEYDKDVAAEGERMKKESEKTVAEERKALEDYIKKNNINAIRTPSGAFVEVKEKGTEPVGDSSYDAVVIYTGKLFKGGTTFDSNVGSGTGLKLSLGHGTTVKGFDEGLMYFGKGGKGKIYIPSDLGYGPRGSQGAIPPNSTLVFEVEMYSLQKRTGGAMPFPAQVNLSDVH